MDRRLIEELINDKFFNIYTRNGLEYVMENELVDHGELHVCLIDICNVKKLNEKLGYRNVNMVFRNVLSGLKDYFIMGRAFSGDEIFFITNKNDKFPIIETMFDHYNLKFRHVSDKYGWDIPVEEFLNNMIDKLQ